MSGRRRKYTAKSLQDKIDEYFKLNPEKPTIYGLAIFLDVTRETVHHWQHEMDGNGPLSDTTKKAIARIAVFHEERMISGKGSPVGSIFWLKSVMGMQESAQKVEQEISGGIEMNITIKGADEIKL